MKFTIFILTLIKIICYKFLCTFPLFYKVYKCTFISTCICLCKDSKSCCWSLSPFTNIAITFRIDPHTTSMFQVILPLSLICLTIWMYIFPLTMHFVLIITSFIDTSICKYLDTFSVALISMPLTVISLPTVVHHNSITLSLSLNKFSIIHSFFILFKSDSRWLMKSGHVKYGRWKFLKMFLELWIGVIGINIWANDWIVAG